MASLNKVLLIGHLGKDVDLKYTNSGLPIANISLATDESYVGQDGNKIQKTEWHRVIIYDKQAENCAKYLQKGSMIFVEGSLTTRKWQDQDGATKYTTEIKAQAIKFLDKKGDKIGNSLEGNTEEGHNDFSMDKIPF